MVVKTFRGQLTDSSPGNQQRIRLQTIKGKMGYKIIKFQLFGDEPGEQHTESTVKIYKKEQTTINNNVNFGDSDLLGAAYLAESDVHSNGFTSVTIFDNEIVNQDIYLTHQDTLAAREINYYIELEVIPLDDAGAEYTTLKDMRQS